MLCPQELTSSVPPHPLSTGVLGLVPSGLGSVFLGQKAVFEYLKSCVVLCLSVVCRHCAVHLSPCLFSDDTVKCATRVWWSSKTEGLLFNKVS